MLNIMKENKNKTFNNNSIFLRSCLLIMVDMVTDFKKETKTIYYHHIFISGHGKI